MRATLAEESFEGWREVVEGLEDWPRWEEASSERVSETTKVLTDSLPEAKLGAFISAARACADEMASNAGYIEKELPGLELSEERKEEIRQVCSDLVGTRWDIGSELSDLLNAAESGDRKRCRGQAGTIVRWLGQELPALDALVKSLESAKEVEPGAGSGFVLIAESAANIVHSFLEVSQTADDYREALERGGAGED